MKKIISIIVVVILGAIFIPQVINYFFPKSNDTADYDGGNHTDHVNVTVKNFEGPESTKSRTLTASDGDLYFGNKVIYCEGYDFLGLYDSAEGGTMYVDENQSQVTDIFSSITLYARWSPKTYYIYFDDTESQLSHEEGELSVLYGSSVTSFPVLEKEGHDFLGWASNDGIRYSEGSAVLREKQKIHVNNYQFDESNTITLSPIFEPKKIAVTLDYNDGTYYTEQITVKYGNTVDQTLLPQKDTGSRMIVGWSYIPNGDEPYLEAVKGEITLYAVWKDYKCFTLNDSLGGTEIVKVFRDEVFELSEYAPSTRPGYYVDGWYGSSIYSGNPISQITYGSSVNTFYAKWVVATYTLSFDQTTSGQALPSLNYIMGDTTSLPTLTKEGYTFNGWCATRELSDKPFTSIPETMYGNNTLYASFTPNVYSIFLFGEDESASEGSVNVNYNEHYTLPVPQKIGYSFLGWFDAEGTPYTDSSGNSLAIYDKLQNSELFTHWTIQTFTVTYETDGGSSIVSKRVEYGCTLPIPDDPTKTGVLFDGWYDSSFTEMYTDSHRVTSDLVLYAKWINSTPISNFEELKAISTNTSASYHLISDIDLKGGEWVTISNFSGTLNGKGHKIYNFTISSNAEIAGFFGKNSGDIKNLTFEDFTFSASKTNGYIRWGVIAGENTGKIINCSVVDGAVSYNCCLTAREGEIWSLGGGITGKNSGVIEGCDIDIEINGRFESRNTNSSTYIYSSSLNTYLYVGMLAGESVGEIKQSVASGKIEFSLISTKDYKRDYTEAKLLIGGAIGNQASTVNRCSSYVDIIVSSAKSDSATIFAAGGFVGKNSGSVSECLAEGSIRDTAGNITTDRLGGFVQANDKDINNCYANVSIEAKSAGNLNSYIGGFAHKNTQTIMNSYCTGDIVTNTTAGTGGFVGCNGAGATISKCFATGDITSPKSDNTGYFIGVSESGSSNIKCYYSSSSKLTVSETVSTPTNLEGTAEIFENLISDALLFEVLSWDNTIWLTQIGNLPIFNWLK